MATVQLIDGSIVERVQLTDIQPVGDEGSRRAIAHIGDKTYPVFNTIIDGFDPVWYEQMSLETHKMLKGASHEFVEGSAANLDDTEDKEEQEGWSEYWLVCGFVSKAAIAAVESVGGRVERLIVHNGVGPSFYAVCLLCDAEDEDDYQGYNFYTDDGKPARQFFICSADAHHDLYLYCIDGSIPRFESSTNELCLVTEAEWFAIADQRKI